EGDERRSQENCDKQRTGADDKGLGDELEEEGCLSSPDDLADAYFLGTDTGPGRGDIDVIDTGYHQQEDAQDAEDIYRAATGMDDLAGMAKVRLEMDIFQGDQGHEVFFVDGTGHLMPEEGCDG